VAFRAQVVRRDREHHERRGDVEGDHRMSEAVGE
jgi:hypothetical protein